MNKTTNTTFDELLFCAKQEEWGFVDTHIGEHVGLKETMWAVDQGLHDPDQNVRDLAATILDESEGHFGPAIMETLEAQMRADTHHIVRLRLAVALWKHGRQTDEVRSMMDAALADPDVGSTAHKWLN